MEGSDLIIFQINLILVKMEALEPDIPKCSCFWKVHSLWILPPVSENTVLPECNLKSKSPSIFNLTGSDRQ